MDDDTRQEDPTESTKQYIELTLKALRAEMRTLFVLSVAGNQLLAHVSFGSTVSALGAGLLVGGKILAFLFTRGS